MRRWTWLICGGILLAPLTAVLAGDSMDPYPTCEGEPSPAQQQAAQGAFQAGAGSFQEGDYTRAIEYWRDAYKRDCNAHLLLTNLANAYERVGDRKAAVYALRTYLERGKDIKDRPVIERRIKNLLDLEAAAPKPSAAATSVASAGAVEPLAPATPEPSNSASGRTAVAPWIVVGSSSVVAIVGVLVYAGGSKKVSDSEAACPNRQCTDPADQKAGNDGRNQMVAGGVVAGIGLAGVASGLLWHFVFDKPKSIAAASTPPTLQPTMGSGYAGLSYVGSF